MTTLYYDYSQSEIRPPTQRRGPSLWPGALMILVPLAFVLLITAVIDLTTAGIVYALAVLILSFTRPHIALALAFALAPFVEELPIPGPVHISIGEFTLALCLPAFLITGSRNLRFPAFLFCTILYVGACLVSCIANVDKEALTAMIQTVLYLIVTVLIFSSFLRNPAHFVFILEAALVVIVFLAFLTYTPIAASLGLHKNALGA